MTTPVSQLTRERIIAMRLEYATIKSISNNVGLGQFIVKKILANDDRTRGLKRGQADRSDADLVRDIEAAFLAVNVAEISRRKRECYVALAVCDKYPRYHNGSIVAMINERLDNSFYGEARLARKYSAWFDEDLLKSVCLAAGTEYTPIEEIVEDDAPSQVSPDKPQRVEYVEPVINIDVAIDSPITSLKFDSCRWPIGEPSDDDFRFCCRKTRILCVGGRMVKSSYCADHHAIAYRPSQATRRVYFPSDGVA